MKHRGKILRSAIEKLRINQTQLAKAMQLTRKTVYNHTQSPNLELEILLKYGKALRYDFSVEIPEINLLVVKMRDSSYTDSQPLSYGDLEKDRNYWKDKYIELLEKHNALLEDRQKEPGERSTNGALINV